MFSLLTPGLSTFLQWVAELSSVKVVCPEVSGPGPPVRHVVLFSCVCLARPRFNTGQHLRGDTLPLLGHLVNSP